MCLKYAEMLLFAEDATILFTHQNSAEISEVHKKLLENNTKLVPSKQLANQCKYNKICNISQKGQHKGGLGSKYRRIMFKEGKFSQMFRCYY